MMKKGILFVLAAAFLASCQQEENEGVASVDRVLSHVPQRLISKIRIRSD